MGPPVCSHSWPAFIGSLRLRPANPKPHSHTTLETQTTVRFGPPTQKCTSPPPTPPLSLFFLSLLTKTITVSFSLFHLGFFWQDAVFFTASSIYFSLSLLILLLSFSLYIYYIYIYIDFGFRRSKAATFSGEVWGRNCQSNLEGEEEFGDIFRRRCRLGDRSFLCAM